MSQLDACSIADVARKTWFNWETDGKPIPSDKLTSLSLIGVDVLYILTGQRTAALAGALAPREAALLDNYRACGEEDQRAIDRVALTAKEAQRSADDQGQLKRRA